MPFLSIIVPIYNSEEFLSSCLDSIINQTFKDFELILINDGSTDRSLDICNEYKDKDSRIRIISKENAGLVSARKTGVSEAKGQYIGFVDSDDIIENNMFENMCDCATKQNADVVICDIFAWDGKNINVPIQQNIQECIFDKKEYERTLYKTLLNDRSYYNFGFLPAMWNKIYRSDILKKNQLMVDDSIRIGEDAACSYFCILDADRICYLKGKFYYHYRENQNSMCRNWKVDNISATARLLEYMYERLIEYNNDDLMEQFYYYFSYMYTNLLNEYTQYKLKNKTKLDYIFKEKFDTESYKKFKEYYEKLKLPYRRRKVIEAYVYNKKAALLFTNIIMNIKNIVG